MSGNRRIVILGAGPPHRGVLPAVLHEPRPGTSVLHWLLRALDTTPQDVTFVAGYQADVVRHQNPQLHVVENADWETSGSGASLLVAPLGQDSSLLVSYGDILFREDLVRELESVPGDVAVAWDSAWRHRYLGRQNEDLVRSEKVVLDGHRVMRLGSDLATDWADGEFVGLVRFSARAMERLCELQRELPESLRTTHLSGLIEYLRAHGSEVVGVDVAGDWAEVNEPRDIAQFVLGTKAETLKRLQLVVRESIIQDQVAFSVSDWMRSREDLTAEVQTRFGNHPLVVRSSARSEDSFLSANAGVYESVLNVRATNGLALAVDKVIASYGEPATDDQVLIQPMVLDVALSGVAFTRTLEYGAPWYVINYETDGNTEGITSGASRDHKTLVVRRGATVEAVSEPRLQGLLQALEEIEGLLAFDALDVEFAVSLDGSTHILQVRPIAVDHGKDPISDDAYQTAVEEARSAWKRLEASPPHIPGDAPSIYGVMPDWNPAEIIGTAPGALAESLYRFLIMDDVWAVQRAEYGYRDVRPAPLLVSFAGRPYVDARASFASFIPASVSDALTGRLLRFYLEWLRAHPELHDKVEFEVVPTCMAPGFNVWKERLRSEGGFSSSQISELTTGLLDLTAAAFDRCEKDLASIERLSQRFEAVMRSSGISPLERARLLLEDCRRFGTLPFAHLARSGFVAVTQLRGAESEGAITAAGRESFFSTLTTVSGSLSDDARAVADDRLTWDEFVEKYGHLRPGTYDITSPRYDSDPESFLRPLVVRAREVSAPVADGTAWQRERGELFRALASVGLPSDPAIVERFLRQAIEGREYSKFVFSRNLSAALEEIGRAGEALGLSRAELADIPIADLLELRDARKPDGGTLSSLKHTARRGQAARRLARVCEMPPLLTGEEDFDSFLLGTEIPNFVGSEGVTAECIDLSEVEPDTSISLEGYIVLIPQADPGYDWLFGRGIAGLVTMYGGANSHMAIRAAEFNLPAAIGVGERRFRELMGGRILELAPPNRTLRVVQ